MARSFQAENKALIREMEQIALARRAELECRDDKSRFLLPQFAKVESKVKSHGGASGPISSRSATEPARSSRPAAATAVPARFVRKDPVAPKPAVPRASDAPVLAPHGPKDHITSNVRAVVLAEVAAPAPPSPTKHGAYGTVPAYLRARQRSWAAEAEEQRLAAENADVPKGMRLMTEAEKAESITLLEASIADARAELSKFKLRVEIPSHIKRRAELEASMTKMEGAMAVFRRPRVFVPA